MLFRCVYMFGATPTPPTKSCKLRLLSLVVKLFLSVFAYTQMHTICIFSTNLKPIAEDIHTLYII